MGAWGPGNLENDGAQDELANVCEGLFNELIALLQQPRAHEYDGGLINRLFVRIETLFALHEREMLLYAPEQKAVGILIDPFVERWQQYHREAGHEPPAARLLSIRETFSRLLEVIREVHEDSPGFEPVEIDWDSPDLPQEHKMVLDLFDRADQRANDPRTQSSQTREAEQGVGGQPPFGDSSESLGLSCSGGATT